MLPVVIHLAGGGDVACCHPSGGGVACCHPSAGGVLPVVIHLAGGGGEFEIVIAQV